MNPTTRAMPMNITPRAATSPNARAVTIAANPRARGGPDIDISGLRFDNYRRNPVVMWAHDAIGRSPSGGLPIGRTISIANDGAGGIIAEFEFLEDDDFAQRVRNAWDKGFLQAASISWLPLETQPAANGRPRDIRAELLEWSIVSVPADPDALRLSHRRMLDSLLSPTAPAPPTAAASAYPIQERSAYATPTDAIQDRALIATAHDAQTRNPIAHADAQERAAYAAQTDYALNIAAAPPAPIAAPTDAIQERAAHATPTDAIQNHALIATDHDAQTHNPIADADAQARALITAPTDDPLTDIRAALARLETAAATQPATALDSALTARGGYAPTAQPPTDPDPQTLAELRALSSETRRIAAHNPPP